MPAIVLSFTCFHIHGYSTGVNHQIFGRFKNNMNKFSKALLTVFAIGALSQGFGKDPS